MTSANENPSPSTSYESVAGPTTRRGGAMGRPPHVLQLLLTTVLLVASSVLLIYKEWLPGFVLLLVGLILSMINTRRH